MHSVQVGWVQTKYKEWRSNINLHLCPQCMMSVKSIPLHKWREISHFNILPSKNGFSIVISLINDCSCIKNLLKKLTTEINPDKFGQSNLLPHFVKLFFLLIKSSQSLNLNERNFINGSEGDDLAWSGHKSRLTNCNGSLLKYFLWVSIQTFHRRL